VALFVRALLWLLLIVAPGGIFLLPFLVGDAVARRRKEHSADKPADEPPPSSARIQAPVGH